MSKINVDEPIDVRKPPSRLAARRHRS